MPILSSPEGQFDLYQRLPERVRKKIAFDAEGCWLWTAGVRDTGYGTIWWKFDGEPKRNHLAHRAVYRLLVSEIPAGLQLDHLCRVITCVHPDHLEPVTQRENIARGESATVFQARKTHCKYGHPFAGDNLLMHKNGRWRICRTCETARYEAAKARNRARTQARRERGTAA